MNEEIKKDWLNDLDEDALPLLEVLSGHASCILTLFSILEKKFHDKKSFERAKLSYLELLARLVFDDKDIIGIMKSKIFD